MVEGEEVLQMPHVIGQAVGHPSPLPQDPAARRGMQRGPIRASHHRTANPLQKDLQIIQKRKEEVHAEEPHLRIGGKDQWLHQHLRGTVRHKQRQNVRTV